MRRLLKCIGNSIRSAIDVLPIKKRIVRPRGQRKHFSAYGEDVLVASWLSHLGIHAAEVRYLDIGASHPTALSNTYLLYHSGASGVLVEPNPDLTSALRRVRRGDTVVTAGAAFDDRKSATLTRLTSSVFNTFSKTIAEAVVKQSESWQPSARQQIVDQIEVPLMPLNDIIDRHLGGVAPHFLSIDCEGYDLQILKALDLERFAPLFICIEASDPIERFNELLDSRYRLIGHTPDNFVFMLRAPDQWQRRPTS